MGKIRQASFLLLALVMLLCGCSTAPVVVKATPTPRPIVVAGEVAEVTLPKPEIQPERLEVKATPPPIKKRPKATRRGPVFRAPKAPVAEKEPVKAKPHPVAAKSAYPKATAYTAQIKKSQSASRALQKLVDTGKIVVAYHGTGNIHQMVYFSVTNVSDVPVKVKLVPGMILNPGGQKVQPLLTVDEVEVTLEPGEHSEGALTSYCMDSRVPAPMEGEMADYKFAKKTKDGGPKAVRAYLAAQKLAKKSPYRHAITQIAIWESLGQPVEQRHYESVLRSAARNPQVRREVDKEVERVLRSL